MRAWLVALALAVVVHALILAFGGIFWLDSDAPDEATKIEELDLLAPADEKAEPEPAAEPAAEELTAPAEAPPSMQEIEETAETPPVIDTGPRLEALSLGALENILDPGAAGGIGFDSGTGSLASGGRIGGSGSDGGIENPADAIFDVTELDQPARAVVQGAPRYPSALQQRKVEGTVHVVFVVDREGRVLEPRVETSSNEGFDSAALEAVQRWRFDPAVAGGEKVRSKMRVPIRFSLQQ